MAALNWGGALLAVGVLFVVQFLTVALGRALRTYSRSRLETICIRRRRPDQVRLIEHAEEATERSADSLAVITEIIAAVWLTLQFSGHPWYEALTGASLVTVWVHFLASLTGRVWAETLLGHFWGAARPIRVVAWPLTSVARGLESAANRLLGDTETAPRPASVQVEIVADSAHPEVIEPDVSKSTRARLEQVVGLTRLDVSQIMTPRSSIVLLPTTATARQAAKRFGETGFSRIPIYGENRDDIVGILYAKDLFPAMFAAEADPSLVLPSKLVRKAYFVPESKNADDLMAEFQERRSQIAIVLDEYGGVAGLITLEDLFEQLVGAIADEHDIASTDERIKPLGETKFEVDASLPLNQLNALFQIHLPTDGRFQTVGGYAFNELGRLPKPGEMFQANGVQITILEVVERSIRRLLLDLG